MIKPLPKWVLTDKYPAFYDTESVTAIEMVAKLYGSMQELITDYNKFVDEVNQAIKDFEDGMIASFEEFKTCVMSLMENYIASVDMKIQMQDQAIADKFAEQDALINEKFNAQDELIDERLDEQDARIDQQDQDVADAILYMKTNLIQTVTNLFEQALLNGDITTKVSVRYNAEDEELLILDTMVHAEDGEY